MSSEHRFRGPGGRFHVPRWSTGCYHERPADCCWLCLGRLVGAGVGRALRARLGGDGT